MQFFPKLSEQNIKRMCNRYLCEMVEADNFEIKNNTIFVKLNYWSETEYYPIGKITGELNEKNIDGFKHFFKSLMKGVT